MEEHVGQLWHKLVTRAADRQYSQAAVSLEEVGKTAGIFFRALGGDAGLRLAAAPSTRHGARRRWLERLAGQGEKTELAWRDQEALRLPQSVAIFPERSLNRDLYLWLAALAATATDNDLPWIIRSQQATLRTLEQFPGIFPRYQALVAALLPLRRDPASLPRDEALVEQSLRRALLDPGSVSELPMAQTAFEPVPLWLHPNPPGGERMRPQPSADAPEGKVGGGSQSKPNSRRLLAEESEMPDGKDGLLMLFRAESLFSWAEHIRVNRPQDEEDNAQNAAKAAEDMDHLTVARDGKSSVGLLRFDLDLPAAGADDVPLGEGVRLPEWDWKHNRLQPDYCCLQEMVAREAEPCELPQSLRRTARRLRSQFQALAPARTWLRAQASGEDLDLDACIEQEAERSLGLVREEAGLYRARVNRERDLSCLLLADLSLSTDAYASDHARVIDVIRDSLFLFSEALSATDDRFSLYGFSSLKRNHVRFHRIKSFDETYGAAIRGRIAAIKPGYYTRMGAAIRQGTALLGKEPSSHRLLLLLTDGKPNDLDRYEGRYGIEDTKMAVQQAREAGLKPFCVTIDAQGNDYLPHLFGAEGYAVIRRPEDLPGKLLRLYAQMT